MFDCYNYVVSALSDTDTEWKDGEDGEEGGEESLMGKERDQMDTSPVGGEYPGKRKRRLTDDDPTSDDSGTNKKQSSDQHNENERKRFVNENVRAGNF